MTSTQGGFPAKTFTIVAVALTDFCRKKAILKKTCLYEKQNRLNNGT